MEGLLRSPQVSEIDRLFAGAFDLLSPVVYFPVRHHSPACSVHLTRVIAEYRPEIVLIEGPSDANYLLQYLADEDSQAPLCIYYSYSDSRGLLGDKGGKYACYYPFLDYSPELVALRQGRVQGVPARFIDLPYPEILFHSKREEGLRDRTRRQSYNDDYLLERSKFIRELCLREGCRDFNELWEKLYEIDGLGMDTGAFVRNMLAFCFLSRQGYTQEMLEEEGNLAREKYMAAEIRQARDKYSRVLVVTGGFHTSGLLDLAEQEEGVSLHELDPADWGAYGMAYSFAESDQLSGYASGMPYPAFYQKVWENLQAGENSAYEQAVLHFVVRCGLGVRKLKGLLSTADEIEAYSLAQGLKTLREKAQCGAYELLDCIQASFVKGELTLSSQAPLAVLRRLLQGRKIGRLCQDADVPPIVKDFRETLEKLKLKGNSSAEQEIVLDIYKNKRQREISRFLHTMLFLDTGFCQKVKGPDLVNRRNTSLVRETWKYRWSPSLESRLIELSLYGGSIRDAARAVLAEKMQDCGEHSGDASLLLADAFLMGLEDVSEEILSRLAENIHQDGVFFSVSDCLYNLNFLHRSRRALAGAGGEELKGLCVLAYQKCTALLPGLRSAGEEEENQVLAKLKDIYYVAQDKEMELDREILADSLRGLSAQREVNSCVEGAAVGLLLGLGEIGREEVSQKAKAYLYGSGLKLLQSARFLKGLFAAARDSVLADDSLVAGLDHVLNNIGEEDFLRLAPDLRLAFSFFTPNEIDEIGKRVAGIYGIAQARFFAGGAIDPGEIRLGLELDSFAFNSLQKWGVLDEQ